MRILVFMSDNRNLDANIDSASYNSLVAAINQEYCKRYNYDFVYYRPYLNNRSDAPLYNCIDPNTGELRHASWSKLLSTSKLLESSYDYIVYIDSDCIFKDFNQSLENFFQPYSHYQILFLNNKPCHDDNLPCAGFYALRINDYTRQFVREWYAVNLKEKNRDHMWEQEALWLIYTRYHVGIIDSWMFREVDGQFLRHIHSYDNALRIPYFRAFIDQKAINYEDTILQIKIVEFNTNGSEVFTIDNSNIDWQKYLSRYPDLISAGICTKEGVIKHWLKHGKAEGRISDTIDSEVIDWEKYLSRYPDLVTSGICTKEEAIKHWIKYGKAECRIADTGGSEQCIIDNSRIDWERYLTRYPDLVTSGIRTKEWAIRHWMKYGKVERRTPF